MNYLHIDKASIADGLGVRTVLWVSGCTVGCKGCQNPESWNFNAGKPFDNSAYDELMKSIDKPYIRGITISGGHPLEDQSVYMILLLIRVIKDKFPSKDVWLYTGYKWEDIMSGSKTCFDYYRRLVVELCDVVVDGEFRIDQHDSALAFRGSKNQRIIDVKNALMTGSIIPYNV